MASNQHPGISWTVFASGITLAFIIASAGWTLFQDKFTQAKESDADLRRQISRINDELLQRRHEFVTSETFEQFEKRFGSVERRLDTIEQTRPTAGTLSEMSSSTKDMLKGLEERVRAVEGVSRR